MLSMVQAKYAVLLVKRINNQLSDDKSSNLKIHLILIKSGRLFLGYVLFLIGGAYIFMICERPNEVGKIYT